MATDKKTNTNGAIEIRSKNDSSLPRISESDFKKNPVEWIRKSREGGQFAVINSSGVIMMVVGMNGTRMLPDRPIDPLLCEDPSEPIVQDSQWVE